VGVDEKTVRNIDAEKRRPSKNPQSHTASFLTDRAKANLRELESPPALKWVLRRAQ
jgi:hypothetical protein